MKKFDLIAISVILAAGLALAVVLFAGSRIPVEVTCQYPAPCTEVGPYGVVGFEFSRPVKSDLVEALWRSTPSVQGSWEWTDDRHARWRSLPPLLRRPNP
ncbi:MAG: hypothetical protein AB9891_00245 [Anaerolineaceae bacterium]